MAKEPNDPLSFPRETLASVFKRGAELTDELLRENERLRSKLAIQETENVALRTQLASNRAIDDLLKRIDGLETDRKKLLAQVSQVEEHTSSFGERQAELEDELSKLANLYIASFQLHATLVPDRVVRHLKELLGQLIGSRAHAYYLVDGKTNTLVPVASEGVSNRLTPIRLEAQGLSATEAAIERAFVSGVPFVNDAKASPEGDIPSLAACIPLRVDERLVGVCVVFTLLAQKERFSEVDHELFKMLGAHAGTALVSSMFYRQADGVIPPLEMLSPKDARPADASKEAT